MVKTIDNMIINTSVKPSYFDDGYTYTELIGMLTQKIIECINSCNLNTEDTNKIKEQWNELITSSEDGKNVLQQLEYLIKNFNLDIVTEEEIYKLFDLENPSTDDSKDYATNPDIDNIFK